MSKRKAGDSPEADGSIEQAGKIDGKKTRGGGSAAQIAFFANAQQRRTLMNHERPIVPELSFVSQELHELRRNYGLYVTRPRRNLQHPARRYYPSSLFSRIPRPRRNCNCFKSKCLKLYCECFAMGEYCNDRCQCLLCGNTGSYDRTSRFVAIMQTWERKPKDAFQPKLAQILDREESSSKDVRTDLLMNQSSSSIDKDTSGVLGLHKGCQCSRCHCLKNYCECFQAGVRCTDLCRCIDCKNIENTRDHTNVLDQLYTKQLVMKSYTETLNNPKIGVVKGPHNEEDDIKKTEDNRSVVMASELRGRRLRRALKVTTTPQMLQKLGRALYSSVEPHIEKTNGNNDKRKQADTLQCEEDLDITDDGTEAVLVTHQSKRRRLEQELNDPTKLEELKQDEAKVLSLFSDVLDSIVEQFFATANADKEPLVARDETAVD
eukprot:Clim_evm36s242 gene=Clim_evmTU36s242